MQLYHGQIHYQRGDQRKKIQCNTDFSDDRHVIILLYEEIDEKQDVEFTLHSSFQKLLICDFD